MVTQEIRDKLFNFFAWSHGKSPSMATGLYTVSPENAEDLAAVPVLAHKTIAQHGRTDATWRYVNSQKLIQKTTRQYAYSKISQSVQKGRAKSGSARYHPCPI